MNNSRTADKFVVRLPEGLRSRIANLAFRNHRSMNSEIVTRLESYLDTKNELDNQKQLVRVLLDRIEHLEKQGERQTMIITTRFTTGTYVARAKGQNITASCAESARRAAERVAEKLGYNPDLLELEDDSDRLCTFSLPELNPQ